MQLSAPHTCHTLLLRSDAGPSFSAACCAHHLTLSPAGQAGPSSMQQDSSADDAGPQDSDSFVSDFRDYGYEDSYDGTSMAGSEATDTDGDEAEVMQQVGLRPVSEAS